MTVSTNDKMTGFSSGSGGGGGTSFTYDATLQAAKATVDGTEVLAPKRSGNGILAQVVPRTNTLTALLATQGNAGELAYPSNAPGLVQLSGVAGTPGTWFANDGCYVVNLNTSPDVVDDSESGATLINVPDGVRNIILTAGGGTSRINARPGGNYFIIKPAKASTQVAKISVYLSFLVAQERTDTRFNALQYGFDPNNAFDLEILTDLAAAPSTWDYVEFFAMPSAVSNIGGAITYKAYLNRTVAPF